MKMKAIIILLISLFIGLQMPTAKGQKLPTRTIVVNGVSFNMIHVEGGGTFMMGSTDEQESGAEEDEFPAHSVTLRNYYIGETEVTQALWVAVMENNPSFLKACILRGILRHYRKSTGLSSLQDADIQVYC